MESVCIKLKKIYLQLKFILKFKKYKSQLPKIYNNNETLSELVKTNKSFIRFGDGEFQLMDGFNLDFQDYSESLADALKNIFFIDNENLLTGTLWNYYNLNCSLRYRECKYILKFLPKFHAEMCKYYNPLKSYWSSFVTILFITHLKGDFEEHYNSFKKIWDQQEISIICGNRVFKEIKYNIFENAASINYILGPTKNAYCLYEELKKTILTRPKDELLIFALGPCGKVLAYEAFLKGYRVLDLGHLIKDYDYYQKTKRLSNFELKNIFETFFAPD